MSFCTLSRQCTFLHEAWSLCNCCNISHVSFDRFEEDERRVFSIEFDDAEGDEDVLDLDVFLSAGGKNRALQRTIEGIPVTDKFLNINFDPVVDWPQVAAIEVSKTRSALIYDHGTLFRDSLRLFAVALR
jgi:hypothetical protein